MTIGAGVKFGPYEFLERIGAGGMGEVWRARDTRLDRDVAVKVLPDDFAASEAMIARFEREAKVISALNHAHICTLFDIGEEEGRHYLVMELIEGESLAERLETRPLPLQEALRCAREIASALDAAHRKGITHRDLKPANVMLTKSGAKLLDFGLAKTQAEGNGPLDGLTGLATEAKPLTEQGTILGTFQYMAPEQLEGLEADHRTDIFAFGALVYEMVTGFRAFQADSKTSLIAAIVASEPAAVSTVAEMTPPALDHLVSRCLEKDPESRWQSARDVASELEWISEAGSQAGVAAPTAVRRKTRERLAWIGIILAAIAATFFATASYRGSQGSPATIAAKKRALPRIAFDVSPTGGHSIFGVEVSPDGRRIAYGETDKEGIDHLVVKDLDAAKARYLKGTEFSHQHFWSPDSNSLAFLKAGHLYKVDLEGGSPIKLSDSWMNPRGRASWGPDGRIYIAPQSFGAIHAVPDTGGAPYPVTTDEPGVETSHRHAYVLPNGKLLFQVWMAEGAKDREGIYIASPGQAEKTFLMKQPGIPDWQYANGFILRKDPKNPARLLLHRLDEGEDKLEGDPLSVDVPMEIGEWHVSKSGVLAVREPAPSVDSELVLFDRDGTRLGTVGQARRFSQPRLSPDMKYLAVRIASTDPAEHGIWSYDIAHGSRTRIAKGDAYGPQWSPDGLTIYYDRGTELAAQIQRIRRDGVGEAETVVEGSVFSSDVAPDGGLLYFERGAEANAIKMLPANEGGKPRTVLTGKVAYAAISPDLSLIAYGDFSEAPRQVYAQRTDGRGLRVQISTKGANHPRWSRGGNELFYFTPKNELMVVEIEHDGKSIEVSEPRVLFETPTTRWNEFFDLSSNGERFLVIVPVSEPSSRPFTVFLNWMPESFNGG